MFSSKYTKIIVGFIFCILSNIAVVAQTGDFTFQGKLTDQNAPANGTYDLSFKLFNGEGLQVGPTLEADNVQVTNGIFTVTLNFGAPFFDGGSRSVEVSVRPGSSTGAYTTLSPKQSIVSTPYAVRSLKAATADAAADSLKLAGLAATEYVKTNDPRMTDARQPLAGSGSYIQSGTGFVTQSGANFNIAGSGFIGDRFAVGYQNPNAVTYRLQVYDPSNKGLRVETDFPGGTVASFGGEGDFQVDAVGVPGGRFVVKENGRVGIGTAQPAKSLEVLGDIRASSFSPGSYPRFSFFYPHQNLEMRKWQIYNTGDALNFSALNNAETAEVVWMQVTRTGGTTLDRVAFPNSVVALDVLGTSGGSSLCLNSLRQISNCSSSIRYKRNIRDYSSGLDVLKRLRPVSFNWKADGKPDLGLVAEEAVEAEPLLATYDDKGQIEGIKYDRVGVILVNAVKEQQMQIEEQSRLIARQQQQIDALAKVLCATNAMADVCK